MKRPLPDSFHTHHTLPYSSTDATVQGDRRTVHDATYVIIIDQDGVSFAKNGWTNCGRITREELIEFCVTILTEKQFRNFNIFKKVFEDDLRKAIKGVINFHTMRTSSNNFRKFIRKMKERGCNIS